MNERTVSNSPFDHVANDYDAIRPRYPSALFDRLCETALLGPQSKALEVGPGTGQATAGLAPHGVQILAVELGQEMARIARSNLKSFPNVSIQIGDFETLEVPEQSFDLVYSATALHWIEESIQFRKPYDLLVPRGHLAIINTHHVSDECGDVFHKASQKIYRKHQASRRNAGKILHMSDIKPTRADPELFDLSDFDLFPMRRQISAQELAMLVGTYSPTFALGESERRAFLSDFAELVDREFGGSIEMHLAFSLSISQRRD